MINMGYFPMCIKLEGRKVALVGNGSQIKDKEEKLNPFGAVMMHCTVAELCDTEPDEMPAMVVVGDTDTEEAEKAFRFCTERNIPINVVDVPGLCTFFFPALINRGTLTVSVSTGGSSPAAAAYLKRQIEAQIPDRTEEILVWLEEKRSSLRSQGIMKEAVAEAFLQNRPLTEKECEALKETIEG